MAKVGCSQAGTQSAIISGTASQSWPFCEFREFRVWSFICTKIFSYVLQIIVRR